MTESREVLIDAMSDASGMPAQTEMLAACLDALLAHPVAVLDLLEMVRVGVSRDGVLFDMATGCDLENQTVDLFARVAVPEPSEGEKK